MSGIEEVYNSNSSLFHHTVKQLQRNKQLREQGKHIAIPFGFPRLDKVFPGITPATYFLLSANQKVGKSMITNALFILNALDFIQNKQTNLDVKIFSFNLEMSKESLMRQIISNRLFRKHGIRLNPRQLQSLYEDYILDDKILRFIDEDQEWFEFFSSKVMFIDEIKNPTGKNLEN